VPVYICIVRYYAVMWTDNICRFVGFTEECAVKKAVNLFNGKTLHGRQIRVEESHRTKELTSPRNGLTTVLYHLSLVNKHLVLPK